MRRRIVHVVVTTALALGLLVGSGLVKKPMPHAQLSQLMGPMALQGGGSGT